MYFNGDVEDDVLVEMEDGSYEIRDKKTGEVIEVIPPKSNNKDTK